MIYVIEGQGALVNEKGEETPLKAGYLPLVNPEGLTQVIPARSMCRNQGDQSFKMICGLPKECGW